MDSPHAKGGLEEADNRCVCWRKTRQVDKVAKDEASRVFVIVHGEDRDDDDDEGPNVPGRAVSMD